MSGIKSYKDLGKRNLGKGKSQYENLEVGTKPAYLKHDRKPLETWQKSDMFSFTLSLWLMCGD